MKILTLILNSAIIVLQDAVLTLLEMTNCLLPVIRYFLHVSPSIVGRAYVAKIYTLTDYYRESVCVISQGMVRLLFNNAL